MQNQTNGFTVPQNETVELIETSILNIKTEKDEPNLGLQEQWINFIDSIDDDQIERFLWTFGSRKVLPYLQFLTLKTFIEFFKWELIDKLNDVEELKNEELVLDSETILAYSEYNDRQSLSDILANGFDSQYDSLVELLEFDIDRFILDLQKKKNL